MRAAVRLAILGVFLSATGAGAWGAYTFAAPRGATPPGVRVDGVPLPAGDDPRPFVASRAAALEGRRVKLVFVPDGGAERVLREGTLADLGVKVDVDRVVAAIRALGEGDVVTRWERWQAARAGEIDVPLLVTVDDGPASSLLTELKEDEDTPPVAARLDLSKHDVVPERDGRYVDIDGAVAAILRAALAPNDARTGRPPAEPVRIEVPVASFASRITRDSLAKIDIHQVLASYETRFGRGSRNDQNRARNIEVASSRINGLVLSPGAAVSFNDIVGARSEENGFQKAGEIFKGEMIEGVGGGTCQVASTLHAIAVYGGLDVVERLPHSRPSAYIPMGLDATVVFPAVDLKLRNPFAFPVVVHAWVEDNRLKMELLGAEKPVAVSFGQTVVGSFPYARRVIEEDWVQKPFAKQKGIRGYQVKRSRTLAFSNGERRVETSVDFYPPTVEIYKVPTGFDQNELPPLPEDPKKGSEGSG